MSSGRFSIATTPENCAGCLSCELACSFAFTQRYNPLLSYIQIQLSDDEKPNRITFTDDCNKCAICVQYCQYGALSLKQEGVA